MTYCEVESMVQSLIIKGSFGSLPQPRVQPGATPDRLREEATSRVGVQRFAPKGADFEVFCWRGEWDRLASKVKTRTGLDLLSLPLGGGDDRFGQIVAREGDLVVVWCGPHLDDEELETYVPRQGDYKIVSFRESPDQKFSRLLREDWEREEREHFHPTRR